MNGELRLVVSLSHGKTVAEDIFFTPPFKLYSPFYEENTAKFISMCAAAGVLAGDSHHISLYIGEGCDVHFTDQGYQKLFDTDGGSSAQRVDISVGAGACLKYLPHPVMTFGGCVHRAVNNVDIRSDSRLVFGEIYCCGRTAMGEEFALERFSSRTEIRIDGRADFIDNTLIEPKKLPVRGLGFFEGFTHTGILYVYSSDRDKLCGDICAECEKHADKLSSACSRTERGLSVRALGTSGEDIFELFMQISDMAK
ncbi:MAG: urease accessory protein UreD [Oscillospiraceae bacterium]|nr:urease accessory protein UreD [Oscillospiraceae bacterium]